MNNLRIRHDRIAKTALFITITAIFILISGCASTGDLSALESAESKYAQASSDPAVMKDMEASAKLEEAKTALQQAAQLKQTDSMFFESERDQAEMDHLAYLAEKKAETAQTIAEANLSKNKVAELELQRNRALILAEQRQMQGQLQQQAERQRATQQQSQTTQEQARSTELTALLARAQATGATVQRDGDQIRIIYDSAFNFDDTAIKPDVQQNLDNLVDTITTLYPQANIEVRGFTDTTGPGVYNQHLSEQRALAVKTFMIQKGMPAESVQARGLGEQAPVASNETREGRGQNRRIEVVINEQALQQQ